MASRMDQAMRGERAGEQEEGKMREGKKAKSKPARSQEQSVRVQDSLKNDTPDSNSM